MKRHVMFSRKFPAKHPRAGEPTHFMEKILNGLPDEVLHPWVKIADWKALHKLADAHNAHSIYEEEPDKHHTIRAGKSWKVGDILIPCMWELEGGRFTKGNKKIQCAPELEVVKVWDIEIEYYSISALRDCEAIKVVLDGTMMGYGQVHLAENDGLGYKDFRNWFMMDKKSFSGQVICWNNEVEY